MEENKVCKNCIAFDESTNFCRLNPPIPNEIFDGKKRITISKFPVILMPEKDYCSHFKGRVINEKDSN